MTVPSSSSALFNVFVRPLLTTTKRVAPSGTRIHSRRPAAHFSTCQPRLKFVPKYSPSATPAPAATSRGFRRNQQPSPGFDPDKIVLDEQIASRLVHLVTEKGFGEAEPLHALLKAIDRDNEHVRKVGETDAKVPVVKIISMEDLREEIRNKRKQIVRQKKNEDAGKQVELNWAITENDLSYRLKRIEQFLLEGRRVEILIAQKRGGRRATRDEISVLLTTIRNTLAEVEGGAEEFKDMEGQPGMQVTLFFQPKDDGGKAKAERAAKKKDEREERMKEKEEEKAEKKKKLEKRLAKKKEEEDRKEEERQKVLNLSANS